MEQLPRQQLLWVCPYRQPFSFEACAHAPDLFMQRSTLACGTAGRIFTSTSSKVSRAACYCESFLVKMKLEYCKVFIFNALSKDILYIVPRVMINLIINSKGYYLCCQKLCSTFLRSSQPLFGWEHSMGKPQNGIDYGATICPSLKASQLLAAV